MLLVVVWEEVELDIELAFVDAVELDVEQDANVDVEDGF